MEMKAEREKGEDQSIVHLHLKERKKDEIFHTLYGILYVLTEHLIQFELITRSQFFEIDWNSI